MMTASNRGVGADLNFPDVCNTLVGTATVPIPYPNTASNALSTTFSPNVYLSYVNALNLGSIKATTAGDEAGTALGVTSGTIKGMGTYATGSPIVYVNGLPGTHLGCATMGNNYNALLGATIVPSATNVFYTYLGRVDSFSRRRHPRSIHVAAAFGCGACSPTTSRLRGLLAENDGHAAPSGAGSVRNCQHALGEAVEAPAARPARTCSVAGDFEATRGGHHPVPDSPVTGAQTCALAHAVAKASVRGERLGGRMARVAIAGFHAATPSRFEHTITELSAAGSIVGLILDLRRNPGGDVSAALEIADDLLEPGSVLARVDEADGDELVVRARHPEAHGFALVVLVDEHTGSAAEVLAACLQDHGRALVLGRTSAGKGTAQRLVPGAVEATYPTVRCYRRPGGGALDGVGVIPDAEVPDDRQMDVAMARLRDQVSKSASAGRTATC